MNGDNSEKGRIALQKYMDSGISIASFGSTRLSTRKDWGKVSRCGCIECQYKRKKIRELENCGKMNKKKFKELYRKWVTNVYIKKDGGLTEAEVIEMNREFKGWRSEGRRL